MFGTHGWNDGGNSHIVPVLTVVLNNDGFLSFPIIILEVTYMSKCTCLACFLITCYPIMYISPYFNLHFIVGGTRMCSWVQGTEIKLRI